MRRKSFIWCSIYRVNYWCKFYENFCEWYRHTKYFEVNKISYSCMIYQEQPSFTASKLCLHSRCNKSSCTIVWNLNSHDHLYFITGCLITPDAFTNFPVNCSLDYNPYKLCISNLRCPFGNIVDGKNSKNYLSQFSLHTSQNIMICYTMLFGLYFRI